MSFETAEKYVRDNGYGERVRVYETSSATVELAAAAVGVTPERIIKTLAFRLGVSGIIISLAGDRKVDNKKFKDRFGVKPSMMTPEETLALTGHAIGGVCPFGVPAEVKRYIDVSVRQEGWIYPACGSSHSMIELSPEELYSLAHADDWVDIGKPKQSVPEG